jgi:hypothetical protein
MGAPNKAGQEGYMYYVVCPMANGQLINDDE